MDYRNSDGSLSEMCGNGIRVFGRHLADEGLVDPAAPVPVGTRDGVKTLTFEDDGTITVDMGTPAAARARARSPSVTAPGRPPTSTWATPTPWPSSSRSTTRAPC